MRLRNTAPNATEMEFCKCAPDASGVMADAIQRRLLVTKM